MSIQGMNIYEIIDKLKESPKEIITILKDKHSSGLFYHQEFLEIFIKNIEYLYDYLDLLTGIEALLLLHYVSANKPELLQKVFASLSEESQFYLIDSHKCSLKDEMLYLQICSRDVAERIINRDVRITTLDYLSFSKLYRLVHKRVSFPDHLLEDIRPRMVKLDSVRTYRFMANALSSNNNISNIEESRRRYYERMFRDYDKELRMLPNYAKFYKAIEQDGNTSYFDTLFSFGMDKKYYEDFKRKVFEYVSRDDLEGLRYLLINVSRRQLSDMIIDYHFKDIPHNVFIDIKELCMFQESEGRTLTEEELEIYSSLISLDVLDYDEAMEVHERLKKWNVQDKYYDDYRKARDRSIELISEQILSSRTIEKYHDNELSEKCNVDIYVLSGEPFFAFVKSTHILKNKVLKSMPRYVRDGGSYSLDGSDKLETFKDPRLYYNFIFGSFPKRQVVHMYPVDSYTEYHHGEGLGTKRHNKLYTPLSLVRESSSYSEILLALPNRKSREDINKYLKTPELLGIYCYDVISENDILSARNLKVPIIVIKTNSYGVLDREERISLLETISGRVDNPKYDYVTNVDEEDERTKIM